jgi:hypothetical protein
MLNAHLLWGGFCLFHNFPACIFPRQQRQPFQAMSTFDDAAPSGHVQAPEEARPSDMPSHPFLTSMLPHHSQRMAECARVVDFKPGDLVFKQGDPARRFYPYEVMKRVSGVLIQRLQWTRRKLMKATDSL